MHKEDITCEVCDSEFSIEHYEEDRVSFCPFCGESFFKPEWDEDEEEDEE